MRRRCSEGDVYGDGLLRGRLREVHHQRHLRAVIRPAAAARAAAARPLEQLARAQLDGFGRSDVDEAERVRTRRGEGREAAVRRRDVHAERAGRVRVRRGGPREVALEVVVRLAVVLVQGAGTRGAPGMDAPLDRAIVVGREANATGDGAERAAGHDGARACVHGHVKQVELTGDGGRTVDCAARVQLRPHARGHVHVHRRQAARRDSRRRGARCVDAVRGRSDGGDHQLWAEEVLAAARLLAEHRIHAGWVRGCLLREGIVQGSRDADARLVRATELRVDVREQRGARAHRRRVRLEEGEGH
eukprot:1168664-Prymnesium_polylepis.2